MKFCIRKVGNERATRSDSVGRWERNSTEFVQFATIVDIMNRMFCDNWTGWVLLLCMQANTHWNAWNMKSSLKFAGRLEVQKEKNQLLIRSNCDEEKSGALRRKKTAFKTSDYRTIVLTPGWAIKLAKTWPFSNEFFSSFAEVNAKGKRRS